jgi:hypothetical protein
VLAKYVSQSVLVAVLQRGVVVLALALDRVGECDQARLHKILSRRFFRERATDAAVAVLERMDADEMKVRDAGACERRQHGLSARRSV